MTTAQPEVSRADAESVVEKLQSLREALSPSEQHALDTILRVFEARVTDPSAQELLADFPDGPELLDDVAGFKTPEGQEPQALPVTVVTITTTWASHPWIGC